MVHGFPSEQKKQVYHWLKSVRTIKNVGATGMPLLGFPVSVQYAELHGIILEF